MPAKEDFIAQAAPFRAELIAHCYRMLGSVHDAEDLVQETYLNGWRGYQAFEERAALRTWLYRIATTACLRALQNRARRVLPAGLGDGSIDPDASLDATAGAHEWLEPIPDSLMFATPEDNVTARQSVRLAVMTALQELPARQRAVLILRDVVQFSAAEVAELLETTPAAVNSSLQRARVRLAELSPAEESLSEPDDAERRALLDRYCAAFENADMAALTALLQADVKLEMPPLPVWFTGRDPVLRFLAARAFAKAGDIAMIPTAANAQPAVAEYRRGADGVMRAHSIHVLTAGATGIATITIFLDPGLFSRFGFPSSR
ncbi:RNA polymerase subunit sigma-70 [Mycobacterium nebraskense]|uniref:RNA polymerase sigma factor n=1 Tax=Mycobacterium nebraskense TaxID=244292 RepID=A0A1X1ZWE0_9MYCO|nr:RNA polymerase factor sigma-70 [Mycobacterium nebraskense]MBI2694444.1 sigma-70 family RNA polymerase sigma factor [Mycobacterium nebraskense]MCV7118094.1 sigma-70 family RNA polymerase sigma factor [Mycobacterium nebraskense]ORW28485.1 RNA polymerase subunit sigma-70 [Mycobacterium nebraskense]